MLSFGDLSVVALASRELADHCAEIDRVRHAQLEAARHVPRAAPYRRQQRRIETAQLIAIQLEHRGEPARRHERRHFEDQAGVGRVAADRAEVFLRIAVDLQRREERDVEVARGEAERAAVVLAHDRDDVAGAELLLRPLHAAGTVVVRGQRERPAAEHDVVLLQEARGRFGRAIRIEPFVDGRIDAQEASAGAAHELPHARGADLRIRIRVEGGFDVRQRCELARQAHLGERRRDVLAPGAGTHDAFAEAIRLTELEAHALRRIVESRTPRALRPQVEHALLLLAQVGGAGGQAIQDARVLLLRVVDALGALPRRKVAGQLHDLVDDAQIVLVVQQAALGRHLGIDLAPERDVRLQLGGTNERVLLRGRGQRREARRPRATTRRARQRRTLFIDCRDHRRDWECRKTM